MKFDLDDRSKFMSHLLLQEAGIATSVAETPLWKQGETLEATLQINGVEVPAEVLESFMKGLWDKANEQLRRKYCADSFDKRVESKAKELLEEYAGNALEQLNELTEKLNNIGDVLTPYYERKEKHYESKFK